jgi:hypothetical protein
LGTTNKNSERKTEELDLGFGKAKASEIPITDLVFNT